MESGCFSSLFMRAPLVRALQKFSKKQITKIRQASKRGDDDKHKKGPVLCRFCSHTLTSTAARIDVNGRSSHTFKNPHGIVYNIQCFASARGCLNHGDPTREYTWFPGFSWCYSLCSSCYSHVGWFYQGTGQGFYGLISDHIIESQD